MAVEPGSPVGAPPPSPPPEPPRSFWQKLGPGFVTGASDDDPSGIGTYAAVGATYGYMYLWLAWVCYPLMAAVQVICARIGQVSGRGLAGMLGKHYPRPVLYLAVGLLLVANTINAGADIGAIAAALGLVLPLPRVPTTIAVSVLICVFQIWGSYKLAQKVFKWLALTLLAYIGSSLLAHPDWGQVLRATLIPHMGFDGKSIATLVAILGTTISPYLFFWQATEEVELEKSHGHLLTHERQGATKAQLNERALDVNFGMLFSQIVMFFIILGTGATLHVSGQTDIQTPQQAAQALAPLAGKFASMLFAFGLIGTGILAVPILTASSAFALAETFAWRSGLDQKLHQAHRFYGVIAASTFVGMIINFIPGLNPMSALFWSAVINGLLAPPLLVLIMLISNNREIMGDCVNGPVLNVLGWLATFAMSVAAIALFATWGQ